jgi:hypothetical protein
MSTNVRHLLITLNINNYIDKIKQADELKQTD